MSDMSEWVSINQAAKQFGVSPDTIRRRLKRGELQGRQERTAQGFTWVIEVPAILEASQPEQETPEGGGSSALEIATLRERVAGLERLTTEFSKDRNAWREQAARSEESARELRILVQQAQALPAGDDARQDAYSASPAGPRAPETGAMTLTPCMCRHG